MRNTLDFVVLSIVFARLGIIWQVVRCMCSGTLQPFLCLHWHTPNRPFAPLPIWLDSNSYFPFTASKIYSFHAMFCFQCCVVLFILCVFFLCLVYTMLSVSLDCSFLIAPSDYSYVYLLGVMCCNNKRTSLCQCGRYRCYYQIKYKHLSYL